MINFNYSATIDINKLLYPYAVTPDLFHIKVDYNEKEGLLEIQKSLFVWIILSKIAEYNNVLVIMITIRVYL